MLPSTAPAEDPTERTAEQTNAPSAYAPSAPLSSARAQALAVCLLAALAMLPSLFAQYIYDDVMLIQKNLYAQDLKYAARAFTTHFWNVPAFGSAGIGLTYYRPLVTLSYLVNFVLADGAPWLFHLSNVAMHAACAYLVVQIGQRWTQSRALSAIAGLVFAVHASRAESVIWIAGRTDVMMTLGLLVALQLAAQAAAKARSAVLETAAAGSVVLALLCKEAALMAPLLLGMEYLVARAPGARKSLLRQAGIWLALGGAYVLLRAAWMPLAPEKSELSPLHGLTTLGLYLERIVWPWPQTFFFRPITQHDGKVVFSWPHLALGAAWACGFVAAAAYVWRTTGRSAVQLADNRPLHALGLGVLSAAFMGPLLNFSTTGIFVSTSDHFLYLPLWLLSLGALLGFWRWLEPWFESRAGHFTIVVGTLLSVGMLWLRSFECYDNATLWQRELEINPDNPFVLREVAKDLAGKGQLDAAQELFERSLDPASQQYVMLAPPGSNLEVQHRVISLEATLRADGDVAALNALLGDLRTLAAGRVPSEPRVIGRAHLGRSFGSEELDKALGKDRMRPEWRAEAAFVAARLCRGAEANALLEQVPDRYLASVVSPENLILTELRIGNFERAERRLNYLIAKLGTAELILHKETIEALTRRALAAAHAAQLAATRPEPARSLVLGASRAELGQYLCALRQLRPAYDQAGPDQAPQYVQLLLAAGLQQEAFGELLKVAPPEQAQKRIAAMQSGLSERVLDQTRVEEPSNWWPPSADERLGPISN